ncbi:MAG: response regulator transcription factor, partial [Candidatus Omnitrophica bacterium]|nr:response regulator transcription factor [Candidatus Omnitrophota bacterium]
MMKEKILIVEDDVSILVGLVDLLSQEGYQVITATRGQDAIEKYRQQKPNLILLDVMLPEKNGYDLCREIRQTDLLTGIIMLTAKGQEVDKVVGLELGADDYLVKPFGINELLARIRGVLRRQGKPANNAVGQDLMHFGDVTINPQTLEGKKGKKIFQVTVREITLLQFFLKNEAKVIPRDVLLEEVWG